MGSAILMVLIVGKLCHTIISICNQTKLGIMKRALKDGGMALFAIGDCVEPRTCYDAIHEGFYAAFRLV